MLNQLLISARIRIFHLVDCFLYQLLNLIEPIGVPILFVLTGLLIIGLRLVTALKWKYAPLVAALVFSPVLARAWV